MTSKFNLVITAMTFIPNVIERVIPAFKEEGFGAGIKETGKVLIQAATDFVSCGLGGAIGRVIGGVVGLACPGLGVGVSVLSTIGDMAGSMLIGGKITKAVDKVIGADEETEEKLKEERIAKHAPQQNLAYNQNPQLPQEPQPKFDAKF